MPNQKVKHVYSVQKTSRGLTASAWGMLVFLLVSAFMLVYVKDLHRRLLRDYQHMQSQSLALQTEWEKLLLERSAWMSQERISTLAKEKLGMHLPSRQEILTWQIEDISVSEKEP